MGRARKAASFTPYDNPPMPRGGPGRRGHAPGRGAGGERGGMRVRRKIGDHVAPDGGRSPARRAAGCWGRALTPTLSQGERGRAGPHPPAPLSPRRGGGTRGRTSPPCPLSLRRGGGRSVAGFALTLGRVAPERGAASRAPA